MQWVLFENSSPKPNNNPTPNKYTYTSTLVCGYIMSHYALKCHQKKHRARAITLGEHT